MAFVNLSNLPDPPKEYLVELSQLNGGLNLWDMDHRLDDNQSPDMKNLYWLDGALTCRPGQTLISDSAERGTGHSCYDGLYWEHAFFHIGDGLYTADFSNAESATDGEPLALTLLLSGVPENRGTWFRYGDDLYYKNRGGYFKVAYQEDGTFDASSVVGYVPIIQINTDPSTGAGDTNQPENRLSAQKSVWFSTVSGVKAYHLPVQNVDRIDQVVVDGVEQTSGFTVDLTAGTVTFATEPTHHDPVQVNTVKITYTKVNEDAYNSVMDCPYAVAYGGDQNVCVVLGGCPAQPNAYFWCGNHSVMDAGYFPIEQYNLAGDTEEHITGFGKQQAMLVIFKEKSIGRTSLDTTEMDSGRVMLTMNYTAINSRIGCDLPWSIQLVENNLVFCNTEGGVYILRDSTSAYENNVVSISRNVNGGLRKSGLLAKVRSADVATSLNDGDRYWVVAGGEAYVWDFTLSTYSKPSWFYFTNIGATDFLRDLDAVYHLDGTGRLTAMRETYMDYGGPIEKVYQFASQSLGGYDKLKDVTSVIFVTRADSNCTINISYITDYETREDKTPIKTRKSFSLFPRNLKEGRYLGVNHFSGVARRKPGTRHIRHFSMRLENNEEAKDMSVVSAQIFYRYQGRDR